MPDERCCGCPDRQAAWLDRLTARIRADMAAEEKVYRQWFDRGWTEAMKHVQSTHTSEAQR